MTFIIRGSSEKFPSNLSNHSSLWNRETDSICNIKYVFLKIGKKLEEIKYFFSLQSNFSVRCFWNNKCFARLISKFYRRKKKVQKWVTRIHCASYCLKLGENKFSKVVRKIRIIKWRNDDERWKSLKIPERRALKISKFQENKQIPFYYEF